MFVFRGTSAERRRNRRRPSPAILLESLERRLAMTSPSSGTFGIFSYEATASEVAITGCDHAAVVAAIPASINGLPVTSIGADAFDALYDYDSPLTTVTIPDSVVVIGDYAFAGTYNLASVVLPAGLKTIGYGAFLGSGLQTVSVPAGVTTIWDFAFAENPSLTAIGVAAANPTYKSVGGVLCSKAGVLLACPEGKTGAFSIPAGITSIAAGAFDHTRLTSVAIPDSVTSIGDSAFAGSVLERLVIPGSVTTLYANAFSDCAGISVGFVGGPPAIVATPTALLPSPGAVVRYLSGNVAWKPYAGGKPFDGMPTVAVTVAAPTSVAATVGDGKAVLNWHAASASDGSAISDYVVQYSSNGGATWTTFNDGVTPVTTATVTGLVNGTAYVFRVAAKIDLGAGEYSARSAAVTPGTFGIFKFVSNGVGVTITGCDPKATAARIPAVIAGLPVTAIGANAFKGCGSLTTIVVPGSVTSIAATPFVGCPKLVDLEFFGAPPTLLGGLTSGNPTVARYVKGTASWSGYVGKEFGGLPTQGVEPAAAPAAPTVVAADRRVTLTIPGRSTGTIAPTGPVFDYEVQSSTDGGKTWSSQAHLTPLHASSTVTITGLTNGKPYLFRVAATNLAGIGAFSGTTTAVPAGLPGVPVGLKVTKGDGKVTLSWLPAGSNGSKITQYRIQYSANLGLGAWGPWSTSNQPATPFTEAVLGGLANGKTYRFRIAAVNAVGASDYSSPWINATPGK